MKKSRSNAIEQAAERAMPGWEVVACHSAGNRAGQILDSVASAKKIYGFKAAIKRVASSKSEGPHLRKVSSPQVFVVRMKIKKSPSVDKVRHARRGSDIGQKVVLVAADGKVLGIQG